MIIQHNISAMTTNNNLNISDKNISKSSEKLSTGYRINRAADDASGLTISEKLRGQVRGLNRAEKNIEEGVSLIETADGGMEEIEAILHRQRELSVQAANDTNTLSDREAIQTEIDMLNDEIDRITDETEYNTIKILQGGITLTGYKGELKGGLSKTIVRTGNVGLAGTSNESYMSQAYKIVYEYEFIPDTTGSGNDQITEKIEFFTQDPSTNAYSSTPSKTTTNTYKPTDSKYNNILSYYGTPTPTIPTTFNSETEHSAAVLDFSGAKISDLIDPNNKQGFYSTCCTCDSKYSINFVDTGKGSTFEDTGNSHIYNVDLHGVTDGKGVVDAIMDAVKSHNGTNKGDYGIQSNYHYTLFKQDEINQSQIIIYDGRPIKDDNSQIDIMKNELGSLFDYVASADPSNGLFGVGVYYEKPIYEGQAPLYIQEGANSGQLVKIDLPNTSTKMLGTRENVNVLNSDNATKTIQTFDNAIDYISRKRTELAAKQNSLEYRADYNTNASINQQAAESLIRDTNMADEMVNYSKSSILQQASQSMLAQANQVPQNVISLLQGT